MEELWVIIDILWDSLIIIVTIMGGDNIVGRRERGREGGGKRRGEKKRGRRGRRKRGRGRKHSRH